MTKAIAASFTRRAIGAVLAAAPISVLTVTDNAYAQKEQTMPEKSLYERLGGVSYHDAAAGDASIETSTTGISASRRSRKE